MELSIGFSSCPNDTFIFDALINKKIDCKGIEFKLHMADVKELNAMAFENALDITKLSFHAYAYLSKEYQLLNSGSALGNNCGPLLISKRIVAPENVKRLSIAIPGKYTTANFLLSLAFPKVTKKKEMLFHEIEDSVLKDETDAGLIIHENRFTYQEKGLKKIIDLGEFWESKYQKPIPLGGIAIKRSLDLQLKILISDLIADSIRFAFENEESSRDYILSHAQEMEHEIIRQHIGLYVNEFSIDLGEEGRSAVELLYKVAQEKQLIPKIENKIFVN